MYKTVSNIDKDNLRTIVRQILSFDPWDLFTPPDPSDPRFLSVDEYGIVSVYLGSTLKDLHTHIYLVFEPRYTTPTISVQFKRIGGPMVTYAKIGCNFLTRAPHSVMGDIDKRLTGSVVDLHGRQNVGYYNVTFFKVNADGWVTNEVLFRAPDDDNEAYTSWRISHNEMSLTG